MKNKILKIIVAFIVVLLIAGSSLVFAEQNADFGAKAQKISDDIIAWKLKNSGSSSVQGLIDGKMSSGISSGEWYIAIFSQMGSYDFSKYEASLLNYLSKSNPPSASSRLKYAAVLVSIGSKDSYIHTAINDSIGKQGVMSWIFGLHLINNGYQSNAYSSQAIIDTLLSLQLSDSGWAVMGANGDVDVTAMAIQALAPYYNKDSRVQNAVNGALSFLSERQQASGEFKSFGAANPESTSQVLIALSSLGIDAASDSRFIKNTHTVFDGIEMFRCSDGGFSHTIGAASNDTSAYQILCAMVSYNRMKSGKTGFYIFDRRNPKELKIEVSNAEKPKPTDKAEQNTDSSAVITSSYSTSQTGSEINDESMPENSVKDNSENSSQSNTTEKTFGELKKEKSDSGGISYKFWVCLAIAVFAVAISAVLFFKKKGNFKNYAFISVIAIIFIAFVLFTNFSSASEYYSTKAKNNPVGTVTVSILCNSIEDRSAEHIPDDGIILAPTKVEIEKGDTAYDVLRDVSKKHKIHIETNGSGKSVYVEGIANIYEFDFGELSGWTYIVNGETYSLSSSEYILSNGDILEWKYTCRLGEDLK